MYVLLLSVCLPSLYPFYLSPFFIPSSSSSSFFYVCMYIFIFYLIFYFWTDLGNVCHYNKYMEKFLTIQSSIYLQTNSKNIFSLFFIFYFYFFIFLFLTHFFFFLTHFRNIRPSHNSIEQFYFSGITVNVGNMKKVRFAENPTIYTIYDDDEYFTNYRKPYWELMAVDRHRFKRRIDFFHVNFLILY